jgi:guanylate kinase
LARGVIYTTRPRRDGEQEGVQYHFVTEEDLARMRREGRVLEERTYQTVHGPWTYFTADDGQLVEDGPDVLMAGTPESCAALRRFYGDRLVPLYLTLDDGERLARALARERAQTHPKYAELCRRFLADEADHNPEALLAAGVTKTFDNTELDGCLAELKAYIRAQR